MRLISTGLLVSALVCSVGGCRKAAAPERQTTTGVQAINEPVTVAGCLKSGIGDSTFVLVALDPATTATVTYQLQARADQNLAGHVGERIEVSGTVKNKEEITGTSGEMAGKPAKGTTGTPVVETRTELDIRQLSVDSFRGTGNRCDQ